MRKLFIFILSSFLLSYNIQSQDLIGIDNFGNVFHLKISSSRNYEEITYLENKQFVLNSYKIEMKQRIKYLSNIRVYFGGFSSEIYIDSSIIDKSRFIKAEDKNNIFFVESHLYKESEYSKGGRPSMLFENDSSDLIIRSQHNFMEAINEKTNNSVWKKYMSCGFSVMSYAEKCGYQKPVPVLLGKKFLCIKNRRYFLLPFKYSKIILIDWETGKEEILIGKGFNLQVSIDGNYIIYESKKNTERNGFIVYDLLERKIVKQLYVKQLYFM